MCAVVPLHNTFVRSLPLCCFLNSSMLYSTTVFRYVCHVIYHLCLEKCVHDWWKLLFLICFIFSWILDFCSSLVSIEMEFSYEHVFYGTQKVVVTLSIAVCISSKLPSSMWKMNEFFSLILLKKKKNSEFKSPWVTRCHNFT